MNCLKCGKETSKNQVFCPECLADMDNYPVRPDAPVQIPLRKEKEPVKTSRRKVLSSKELLRRQQKQLRLQSFVIFLLFCIVCLLGVLLLLSLRAEYRSGLHFF